MSIIWKVVHWAMKAMIKLDYRLNPEREAVLYYVIGTKYDDHDFTLVVNRYPKK